MVRRCAGSAAAAALRHSQHVPLVRIELELGDAEEELDEEIEKG
jgi:hypothetical protein